MAGPGGEIVGRVSVKVMPDTSRFADELRGQLKKLEKQLSIKLPVEVDTKKAVAGATKLRKQIESNPAEMQVDIDASGVEAVLSRIKSRLTNISIPSMENIEGSLDEVNRQAQVLVIYTKESVKAALDLSSHWNRVKDSVKGVGRVLSRMRQEGPLVSLDRATAHVMITMDNMTASLRKAGRRVKGFGASIGGLAKTVVSGAVSGIGTTLKKIGTSAVSAGKSLGKMGRGAWIAVAAFAAAAPVIGLVSGLIAGMPSLMAAAGAGIAAIALGMDGIKAAAQTLAPAVDRMKASLSATFAEGLTPVFQQLNGLMPTLEAGLNKVAQGMIPLAQSFTDVVTSAQGMEQVEQILTRTGELFKSLQPMVTTFTQSFLTLANAGAANFGKLAGVLNTFGEQWNAMVGRITANSDFGSAMSGLAQVLGSVLDVFTRLFEAGVKAMGQLGGPMSTLITGFGDILVALMPALTSLSSLLGNVFGTLMSSLAPIISALTPAFQLLANTIGKLLVGAIQMLAPILLPVANILGTVLLTALKAIQPVLPVITNFMRQFGTLIGGMLTQALIMLTPLIQQLGQFFSQLLLAVAPLLPAIMQLAMAVLPPLLKAALQIIPPITRLAALVLPLLVQAVRTAIPVILLIVNALKKILPPIINFVGAVIGIMMPVMQGLLELIMRVWPSIQLIITGVMNIIKGIINTVMGIITGDWSRAWDGIKQIFQGAGQAIWGAITGVFNLIVGFFAEIPGRLLNALGDLGSLLYGAGKSLLQGLWNGISSMVGWIKNKVSGVVQSIRNFFPFSPAKVGPFSGKGYTTYSGRALIEDWVKGIQDEAPSAVRAVEKMMTATNNAAQTEWNGHITNEGFGNAKNAVFDGVMAAFDGSRLQVDGNGMAKLVNTVNAKNNRR